MDFGCSIRHLKLTSRDCSVAIAIACLRSRAAYIDGHRSYVNRLAYLLGQNQLSAVHDNR